MASVAEWFKRLITFISEYFMIRDLTDFIIIIVEIIIIAFVIYKLIKLINNTRAWQLLKGILIIVFVALMANLLGLKTISFIINNSISFLTFAVIVIFQDDLKKILEKLGTSKLNTIFTDSAHHDTAVIGESTISSIVSAVCDLSEENIGAMIVIEKNIKLGEIVASGIEINSEISSELIKQIFVPNTPLHDGAIVVRGNRILAASCLLPLTSNANLSTELGTRHRAAIGISEQSDSITVVVSEETGKISITMEGNIRRGFDNESLNNFLKNVLLTEDIPKKNLFKFRSKKNG